MRLSFKDDELAGELLLTFDEKSFDRAFFTRDLEHKYLSVALNRGGGQKVTIDEIEYEFAENSILPLMVNRFVLKIPLKWSRGNLIGLFTASLTTIRKSAASVFFFTARPIRCF